MLDLIKATRPSILLAVLVSLGLASASFMLDAAQGNANVRKVQQELESQGYYHGHVDGLMGPQTRSAIRQYQQAQHLSATGHLNSQTAAKLGVTPVRTGTHPVEAGNMKEAEKSMGKGGKRLGHEVKRGKPVAGAKDLGKSIGHASKEVGKATKKAVSPH